MTNDEPCVVCIIGMHRSGTSMIARLLNECGLHLGRPEDLLESNEYNAGGYFEHRRVVQIDDALLAHFGGSWDNPPRLDPGWESEPSLRPLIGEANEFLSGMQHHSPWGWKDPRTTVLLPFWKSLVPDLRFVVCIRSPLEVAQSLAHRDKLPVRAGAGLWDVYMRAAIRDTDGCPRAFVSYEDFFADGRRELRRLADFCHLQVPSESSVVESHIAEALRHQKAETANLLEADEVGVEPKLTYLCLRALTSGAGTDSPGSADRRALTSRNVGRLFALLSELHDGERAVQLEADLAAGEREVARLQARVGQLSHRAEHLEACVADREAHVSGLTDHTSNLEALVRERDAHVSALADHARNLEALVRERDAHISALADHAKNLEALVGERDAQVKNLESLLARHSAAGRVRALLRRLRGLDKSSATL